MRYLLGLALLAGLAAARPFTVTAAEQLNIPYVDGGGPQQQLDLFTPDSKGFATVLFVHGGSLTSEDRRDTPYPDIGRAFQRDGVACAVMNYRLGPDNGWPAQPLDVAAAFAWVKTHIAEYGGDPGKIFLVGHSSGGHLVAIVSSDESYLKQYRISLSDVVGCVPIGTLLNFTWNIDGGSPEEHWSEGFIQKVFARGGGLFTYRTLENYRAASPSAHIGPHLPPMLILVAEAERFQPPILSQAEVFVQAARSAGAQVSVEVLPQRKHTDTITLMPKPGDPTLVRILIFLRNPEAQ